MVKPISLEESKAICKYTYPKMDTNNPEEKLYIDMAENLMDTQYCILRKNNKGRTIKNKRKSRKVSSKSTRRRN